MSEKTSPKTTASPSTDSGDLGQAEIQQRIDKEQEQGFVGIEVDPTPNENYTLRGVAEGKPTPETDDKAAAEARKAGGRR